MSVRGTRINASYVGLAARVAAILLGVLVLLLQAYAEYKKLAPTHPDLMFSLDAGPILLPALLLLVVAALASIPVPAPVPRAMQPLAESLVAAIVIGAFGATEAFVPYLLVPVITCGLTAGVAATLGCVATAWTVLLGTAAVDPAGPSTTDLLLMAAKWVPLSVFAGLTAAWTRRVRAERAPEGEPAYADAHRLLSELHVVARQLSLGLDPQTLAAALLDDVAAIVRHAEATVLVRSDSGRFVPLVGGEPPAAAASAMQDAWTTARSRSSGTRPGVHVTAMPVRMGERVVALVVLTGARTLDDDHARRLPGGDRSGRAAAGLGHAVRRRPPARHGRRAHAAGPGDPRRHRPGPGLGRVPARRHRRDAAAGRRRSGCSRSARAPHRRWSATCG